MKLKIKSILVIKKNIYLKIIKKTQIIFLMMITGKKLIFVIFQWILKINNFKKVKQKTQEHAYKTLLYFGKII